MCPGRALQDYSTFWYNSAYLEAIKEIGMPEETTEIVTEGELGFSLIQEGQDKQDPSLIERYSRENLGFIFFIACDVRAKLRDECANLRHDRSNLKLQHLRELDALWWPTYEVDQAISESYGEDTGHSPLNTVYFRADNVNLPEAKKNAYIRFAQKAKQVDPIYFKEREDWYDYPEKRKPTVDVRPSIQPKHQ